MEALSNALQPHKDMVGQVASVVTIAQFFSGAFVCKDIHKKGTTKGTAATPFIGGVVIGLLMLRLGLLMNDAAMIQVNVAAVFLNILYTAFYYVYSSDKYEEVLKPLGIGSTIAAVILGYAQLENPENLEFRYGLITTVLMLLLLGAPFIRSASSVPICAYDFKEIIDKKDASSIPFPLTFMGTIVTFLWLIYGIILLNYFMIFQNVIAFILCLIQLVLLILYPGPAGQNKKEKDL
ncbi:hypothetical protein NQ317_015683 [Molorchus minor]|uniref:Sugar transporter SWEET n=1 Tax=Molorchus minor TaxID=1323400 RepID=A0ABQ9JQK3_9CUCU|nr:hypothetical protein NQ317_015683 [Molorchus minor]